MVAKKKVLVTVLMLVSGTLAAQAQTTIAASVYGAYRSTTSNITSTTQSWEYPSNSAGFLLEARHIKSSWIGYEATYSYNPANEYFYYSNSALRCPTGVISTSATCGDEEEASIHAVTHEITGDWIFSFKHGKLRPFAIIGAGLLIDVPSAGHVQNNGRVWICTKASQVCLPMPVASIANTSNTQIDLKGAFVYGVGWDWSLSKHLGLRFQYRGIVHKGPDLSAAFPATNQLTQDAEPMIGLYYRL